MGTRGPISGLLFGGQHASHADCHVCHGDSGAVRAAAAVECELLPAGCGDVAAVQSGVPSAGDRAGVGIEWHRGLDRQSCGTQTLDVDLFGQYDGVMVEYGDCGLLEFHRYHLVCSSLPGPFQIIHVQIP